MNLSTDKVNESVDDKDRRTCIYSLHYSALDPHKLATGGQDTKIRIWDTSAVQASLVSTLSLHNGAVMCVRFSQDGQYLASSSDSDNIIIIWELDKNQQSSSSGSGVPVYNKVFGSSDVNRESWRCIRRLSGHRSDVVDLAWSCDYSYLASCGLDNSICIWSCRDGSFDLVRRLQNGHAGFVKGIAWDPVGKFLASQSDDKSLVVWNTFDWSIAKRVEEGFEKSLGQTFFKRLSWSPDGGTICAVHAVDKSQLICTASILNRTNFEEEACLVGCRGVIECSAFSPVLYAKNLDDTESYSVCATGSQDGTISLWFQNAARAPLVLENAFVRSVYDICWSRDGMSLAACSGDGTVTLISFDHTADRMTNRNICALGVVVEHAVLEDELAKFGYERGTNKSQKTIFISESVDVMRLCADVSMTDETIVASPPRPKPNANPLFTSQSSSFNFDKQSSATVDANQRIQPVSVSALSPPQLQKQTVTLTKDGKKRIQPISLSSPQQEKRARFAQVNSSTSGQVASLLPAEPVPLAVPKMKSNFVQEFRGQRGAIQVTVENPVKVSLKTKQAAQINVSLGSVGWMDYVESPIFSVAATDKFLACSCQNGSIVTWSTQGGRRCLPQLHVDSQISLLYVYNDYLMCVTSRGALFLWHMVNQTCLYENIALSPILLDSNDINDASSSDKSDKQLHTIISARVTGNGVPLLSVSDRCTYGYHRDMRCWVKISHDNAWNVENEYAPMRELDSVGPVEKPVRIEQPDVNVALRQLSSSYSIAVKEIMTLSVLEERLANAFAMKEKETYHATLLIYAKRIGISSESHLSKVTDLLYEFTLVQGDILGMNRRELLNEILPFLGQNKSLHRLLSGYLTA